MASTPTEIRLRIDRETYQSFSRIANSIGLDPNEMVRVFVRRTIAEKGLPFEMREAANEDRQPETERTMSIHGVSVERLAAIATGAARVAHEDHIEAGRSTASARQDHSR